MKHLSFFPVENRLGSIRMLISVGYMEMQRLYYSLKTVGENKQPLSHPLSVLGKVST